jgi:serine/threonine protein kinase
MPLLTKGRLLVSDVTQQCYRVATARFARGGFGEVYRAVELDEHRDPCGEVALKVSLDARSWHGEAYFGRLLRGVPNVVQLFDAFPLFDGRGPSRQVKYVLVFEWMEDGTVDDLLGASVSAWTEDAVVEQTAALLRALALLHRRGICHGDVTPRNVFVRNGCLDLGDLGIAKQSLTDGPVPMEGAAPRVFIPLDAYPFYWSPSGDVYQVGLLALGLLAGEVVTSYEVSGKLLKRVRASDATKGWIRDALAKEDWRFEDATEALSVLLGAPVRPRRAPRTLRGQRVVFTGKLPIVRAEAQVHARAAGAVVQGKVNGATTLVVAGQPNPLQIGQRFGTKLFDAHRRIRRGQQIAIIDASHFARLVDRSRGPTGSGSGR